MGDYILLIDTATPVCSVAISHNNAVLDYLDSETANAHASELTLNIQNLLLRNQLTTADLAAVAVSMGPGSYTGLRIGVSTAKGLCYALDIPLMAVNTLDAMVDGFRFRQHYAEDTIFVPMIDARRMEVYCAYYDLNANSLSPTEAKIIDATSFEYWQNGRNQLLLFGSGADKFKDVFANNPHVSVITGFVNSARFLSVKAYEKFCQKDFEDLIYFEPFYLKEFVATVSKKSLL